MKRKIFLTVLALAGILGAAFMPAPNSRISVHAATEQSGFVNLYDKDCTDKLAYGQVDDITQYHNNVGWVWDNITPINGQNSYTSGYIDIRGYNYFTTNNEKSFEIICYNADKEPIAWIAENKSASHFREGEKSGGGVVLLSMPVPDATYQQTINGRTLVAIDTAQEFGGSSGGSNPIYTASVGAADTTKQIAFVRVAFANSEQNPYFNAFTDDFEMLIKLNRDETSGGVMNALMVDIHDNVFSGFMLTALNETFEVGTILKNTSNEIIFSVQSVNLYFYYTATNGGWQSILTGVEYFSHYGNETVTLNCPTSIALYATDITDIPPDDNTGNDNDTTNNSNTETTITNIFGNSALQIIFAVFGGLAVLSILSALIGGRRK